MSNAAERLRRLLGEALPWLQDKRLRRDELDSRKRGETKQQHEDRISSDIEANEMLADLVDRIEAELKEQP